MEQENKNLDEELTKLATRWAEGEVVYLGEVEEVFDKHGKRKRKMSKKNKDTGECEEQKTVDVKAAEDDKIKDENGEMEAFASLCDAGV
ncbi:hypothetical protein KAS79_03210 [Candidatus Parcubacteria bacterium]|nr:hypothetical protein [Candidatus Parcubacteria bacterium]